MGGLDLGGLAVVIELSEGKQTFLSLQKPILSTKPLKHMERLEGFIGCVFWVFVRVS
jgi:hypothetical protein